MFRGHPFFLGRRSTSDYQVRITSADEVGTGPDLMPERAAELGVRDSFDPTQNVDGGVRHMRDLLQRFGGDVTLALAAYNAGEAAVRAHGGVPPYAETREYVRRVRALYTGAGTLTSGAVALITAPQRIYREVAEDGTLTFTNLPPRAGTTPSRRF